VSTTILGPAMNIQQSLSAVGPTTHRPTLTGETGRTVQAELSPAPRFLARLLNT